MEMIDAIVLRSLDYKDNSKILYLYTAKGLVSVIAHGVKKMNSSLRVLSQTGNYVRISFSKGEFPSLKEGLLLNEFSALRNDLFAYTYYTHILELVNHTIPEDSNHQKMFLFLLKITNKLNEGTDAETLSFIFELKLLYFLGYGINLKQCNICNRNEDLVFSIEHGGLVCKSHLTSQQHSYEQDIIEVMSTLYGIDLDRAPIPMLEKNMKVIIRNIIDIMYHDYLGFKTKSRSIIEQFQKY
ncbi:MAG: DNA repair protein RecO [Bacilli bacterium]|nr:DNA repair protein RecO [Bacilli bacterium]